MSNISQIKFAYFENNGGTPGAAVEIWYDGIRNPKSPDKKLTAKLFDVDDFDGRISNLKKKSLKKPGTGISQEYHDMLFTLWQSITHDQRSNEKMMIGLVAKKGGTKGTMFIDKEFIYFMLRDDVASLAQLVMGTEEYNFTSWDEPFSSSKYAPKFTSKWISDE